MKRTRSSMDCLQVIRSRQTPSLQGLRQRMFDNCAVHLGNVDAQTQVQQVFGFLSFGTHLLFAIPAITNIILSFKPARDTVFFFTELVTTYADLILHPSNEHVHFPGGVMFPFHVPALTHAWGSDCLAVVEAAVNSDWREELPHSPTWRVHNQVNIYPTQPFEFVIIKTLMTTWYHLFTRVRNEASAYLASQTEWSDARLGQMYFNLMLLIVRTYYLGASACTLTQMARMLPFSRLLEEINHFGAQNDLHLILHHHYPLICAPHPAEQGILIGDVGSLKLMSRLLWNLTGPRVYRMSSVDFILAIESMRVSTSMMQRARIPERKTDVYYPPPPIHTSAVLGAVSSDSEEEDRSGDHLYSDSSVVCF
jgi:hypothetical protein